MPRALSSQVEPASVHPRAPEVRGPRRSCTVIGGCAVDNGACSGRQSAPARPDALCETFARRSPVLRRRSFRAPECCKLWRQLRLMRGDVVCAPARRWTADRAPRPSGEAPPRSLTVDLRADASPRSRQHAGASPPEGTVVSPGPVRLENRACDRTTRFHPSERRRSRLRKHRSGPSAVSLPACGASRVSSSASGACNTTRAS
jgi:hypothetical protein